jgi:hypothetical protein
MDNNRACHIHYQRRRSRAAFHPREWKVNSPKFTCRILHSTDPIGPESRYESTPKR